ncbi:hypothetical protein KC367_g149 [Hortaea werneckii]|nr:hypothetical protein KC367_g149 [Hortaea werneckii]
MQYTSGLKPESTPGNVISSLLGIQLPFSTVVFSFSFFALLFVYPPNGSQEWQDEKARVEDLSKTPLPALRRVQSMSESQEAPETIHYGTGVDPVTQHLNPGSSESCQLSLMVLRNRPCWASQHNGDGSDMTEKDKCIFHNGTVEEKASYLLWRPYPTVSGYHVWMYASGSLCLGLFKRPWERHSMPTRTSRVKIPFSALPEAPDQVFSQSATHVAHLIQAVSPVQQVLDVLRHNLGDILQLVVESAEVVGGPGVLVRLLRALDVAFEFGVLVRPELLAEILVARVRGLELAPHVFEEREGQLLGVGFFGDGDVAEVIVEDVAVVARMSACLKSGWCPAEGIGRRKRRDTLDDLANLLLELAQLLYLLVIN